MTHILRQVFCIAFLLPALGGTPVFAQKILLDWAKRAGGKQSDNGLAVTVDNWGNVYTSGTFNDTMDFGSGIKVSTGDQWTGDAFLAKYDAAGNIKWAKSFGNYQEDKAWDVKTDHQGNVYVTGQYAVSANFNPGGSGGNLTALSGFSDVFVVKYDSTGKFLWAKSMGGKYDDIPYALTLDKRGNIYLIGQFSDTADFDPGPAKANLVVKGAAVGNPFDSDIFFCKLDSAGNYVWAKALGSRGPDYGYSIAVDDEGYVYTTGIFSDTADFNPGTAVNEIRSNGSYDLFLAKYDSTGNYMWAHGFGGSGFDKGAALALNQQGDIYVTGYFEGSIDFDPGAGSTWLNTNGNADVFANKYNKEGNLLWAKNIGGAMWDYGQEIAVDRVGNVILTGHFTSGAQIDLDPGTGNALFSSNGDDDIFVVKLYENGDYYWGFTQGSPGFDVGFNIAVDGSGTVYTTGYFNQTADFDPGSATLNLNSAGNLDFYVQKILCVDTSSSAFSVELCEDEYTFEGITYTASGDYEYFYPNRAGCDSIALLQLNLKGKVIKPVINVNGFVLGTAGNYDRYQWYKNGAVIPGATQSTLTVNENADYSVVVFNENGCTDTSEVYKVTNTDIIEGVYSSNIRVYPNPSSGWIYVTASAPVQLILSGVDGRQLKVLHNERKINIENLTPGMYMLQIRDSKGNLLRTEKIVRKAN